MVKQRPRRDVDIARKEEEKTSVARISKEGINMFSFNLYFTFSGNLRM